MPKCIKNIIKYFIYAFCLLILIFNFSSFEKIGENIAKQKQEYYIAKEYSNKAVVYYDSEKYVLMPYVNNKFLNEYEIVATADIGKLNYEKIKGLRKADEKEDNKVIILKKN